MIPRTLATHLKSMHERYPVLTIVGPRQSGKTTLCRSVFSDKPYTNLERPDIREFAQEDPVAFLAQFPEGCVIDEVQRVPNIASYIQVIVDEKKINGQFILTGSQNFSIRDALSQSLAGRTTIATLLPLAIEELLPSHPLNHQEFIFQGFYPRIYDQEISPTKYYADYTATYVERDLRQLSLVRDITAFQVFLKLCAGRIGQTINFEKLGSDAGISQSTAKEWLSLLEASFVIFRLPPYFSNIRKRLIKSSKMYFYDVGLAAYLLGIEKRAHLNSHPLYGALFENLVIANAVKYKCNRGVEPRFYFYRDSDGNEVDLLWPDAQHNVPIEIKSSQTIANDYFNGIERYRKATNDTKHHGVLVYGGDKSQKRSQYLISMPQTCNKDIDTILNKSDA